MRHAQHWRVPLEQRPPAGVLGLSFSNARYYASRLIWALRGRGNIPSPALEISGLRTPEEELRLTRREMIKRIVASGAVAYASTFVYGGLAGCGSPHGFPAGGVEDR